MSDQRLLINGERQDACDARTWDLVNPATGEVIEQVPFGGAVEARRAIDAAATAGSAWAGTSIAERAAILARAADLIDERADELAKLTSEESGKPIGQARGEWTSGGDYLRWVGDVATAALAPKVLPARSDGQQVEINYRPIGVVGVITAWNFPVYNVNRAVAAALIAGCTVVVRPSEFTPRSALAYGSLLDEAGCPAGVINVINGEADEMGRTLMSDPRVRKLSFTGSVRVGKILMDQASETVTDLALELGGNAPAIITPTVADVAAVAQSAVAAKTRNCGQACIAPQRFIVHESIAEEFIASAVGAMGDLVLGDPLDPGTDVGPLINGAQQARVADIVERSVQAGAQVKCGGHRRGGPSGAGFYFEPTILANVAPELAAMTEEIFGPVMPVTTYRDEDEAIELANATEYGLTAFVWGESASLIKEIGARLEFGMIGLNEWYPVADDAPFGGTKQSGLGRESGVEGLHEYVEPIVFYLGV